ncbi:MAG: hypothetical protein Q9209_006328 [Squamulea sp. 1 TL-2023]
MTHFLELPGEIRNQVYRYVFQADDDFQIVPKHIIKPLSTVSIAPDLTLLFVNRQTHREFFPFVYIENFYVAAKLESSYFKYVRQMDMTRTKRLTAAIANCPHFAMSIDTTDRIQRKCAEEFYLVFSSQDLVFFTEKKYRRFWPILWRMKTLPCTDFESKWLEKLTSHLYLVRVYTITEAIWNDRYSDRSTSAIRTFMGDWDNREPDDPHKDLSDHLYAHLLWVKTISDVQAQHWEAVKENIQQALEIGHPSLLCELSKQWKLKGVCKSGVPSYESEDWRRWQDIGIDLVDTFTLENIDRVLDFPNPRLQVQIEKWIQEHIGQKKEKERQWSFQAMRLRNRIG